MKRPSGILAFATGMTLATVALVWLAWAAVSEMRHSTALLLERRASEVLALTSAALNRDMKGVWLSVLVPMDSAAIREDPPYDLLQTTSRAFARFPYAESFLVWWDDRTTDGRTYVLNRTDRGAPWQPPSPMAEPYPVTLLRDPAAVRPFVERIRQEGQARRRFALIEERLGGVPYQIVVHMLFSAPDEVRLAGFMAFTVNLDWVRREYLGEVLRQVATIDGREEDAMAIAVLDEEHRVVATSGTEGAGTVVRQRTFPLLFFDPALLSSLSPERPPIRQWTAQVQPAARSAGAVSALGLQMLLIATFAGAASLVSMLMTVRAVRASTELATMKSEFVSAVTHELKTPLALIKLVGETLERGRYNSPETIRDYAGILSQEVRRLGRLIENLLTYSRLSDVKQLYSFEALDLSDLVEDAIEPFRPRLRELGFTLDMQLDPDLPQVRADRVALMQVFENIIDNAVKYSTGTRALAIAAARADGGAVRVTFADQGQGIPDDEIPKVFEKFYRGREASEAGSGLGLAIVRRIVESHGGSVSIASRPGAGTTIAVLLPGIKRT